MASTRTGNGTSITHLLGGTKVLGAKAEPAHMQRAIREGLPYRALETLAATLRLSRRDITEIIGMAARTLARRKKQRYLSPLESDRLFRIARITQLAADTLGDLEQARTWLARPNRALGGDIPLTMLDTEIGTHQVAEVLHHINYGFYA